MQKILFELLSRGKILERITRILIVDDEHPNELEKKKNKLEDMLG